MKNRILVPGGAGYIGSHTVYALIESGAEVIVIDNLESGFEGALHPEAVFYKGDIRDSQFLESVFREEKIDGVIHFAANSLVGESMTNPLKYYDNNIGGTRNLLEAMLKYGVKKIVFSSTAAVYGEPEKLPITEAAKTNPSSCYGETKLAMEKMFHWSDIAYGVKYVSLRYFNACGAHESGKIGEAHNPETHIIPLVLQVPQKMRDNISIFGTDYPTRDGTCIRDYIHVSDLADAHILAMNYLLNGGESDVFNLGNGIGFTVREVLKAAENVTGETIAYEDMPRRAGDPAQLVASSEKARRILSWKPSRADLEFIVSSAWGWHNSHPFGYGETEAK